MWAAVCLSKSAQNQFIVNTCQYIYLHWGNGFCWLFSSRLMPVCQICKSHATATLFLAQEKGVTAVLKNVCVSQPPDSICRQGYETETFLPGKKFRLVSQMTVSSSSKLLGMLLCSAFGNKETSSKKAKKSNSVGLPSYFPVVAG